MSDVIFKTVNLSKKYKDNIILDNIDMEIKRGQIYGFIGENGAGKTTLIRILAGLAYPTSGELILFGEKDKEKINKNRSRIGCIVESPMLYPNMTARENLEIERIEKGIMDKNCIDEVLSLVNLVNIENKKVKNFSLGMKQRLGIAGALIASPELLVLDEPVNGLDPTGIIELRALLLKLNKERNMTILISSHFLEELYHLATNYGIIHKGKLLEEIHTSELDGKCSKYIYIKVDDVKKTKTIIETKLYTDKFQIYNDKIIKMYDYIDNTGLVNQTLVLNGVKVEGITLKGNTLEDYFASLIGDNQNV